MTKRFSDSSTFTPNARIMLSVMPMYGRLTSSPSTSSTSSLSARGAAMSSAEKY